MKTEQEKILESQLYWEHYEDEENLFKEEDSEDSEEMEPWGYVDEEQEYLHQDDR